MDISEVEAEVRWWPSGGEAHKEISLQDKIESRPVASSEDLY